MAKTNDALKILKQLNGTNESIKADIAEATLNFEVAQIIYDARTKAGLSQRLAGNSDWLTAACNREAGERGLRWSFVDYATANRRGSRTTS